MFEILNLQEEIITAKNRYLNGLDKLAFAASQVRGLQLELEALQPQLKKASDENEAMMKVGMCSGYPKIMYDVCEWDC